MTEPTPLDSAARPAATGTFVPTRAKPPRATLDVMTSQVRDLARSECLDLLRHHSIGRLAVTSQALPVIVPVNYVADDGGVVFRTEPGGMLDRACQDSVVAFEIDQLAPDGSGGWSVLVVGLAHPLDYRESLRPYARGLFSAMGPGRDRFIRVTATQVSGREVSADVASRSAEDLPRAADA